MAIDTHIKFDGIDGESAHKDHKGEVAVLSWSWGLTSATGASTVAGAGRRKAVPQEMRIVHRYDKASPMLAKQAVLGKQVSSAVLSARKAGEGQKDFLKVTMKDVLITSVQASEGGEGPMEEVAMSYGTIDFEYRPQDAKGSLGSPVQFNWNIKSGKAS
jgi:type VI secretion system secreted protein Hcp